MESKERQKEGPCIDPVMVELESDGEKGVVRDAMKTMEVAFEVGTERARVREFSEEAA